MSSHSTSTMNGSSSCQGCRGMNGKDQRRGRGYASSGGQEHSEPGESLFPPVNRVSADVADPRENAQVLDRGRV